jgi:cell division septation protein DedD
MASSASSASAQSKHVQADVLFRWGKDLMRQQKFAEACAAFESSYKLDPDISTLLNHADCRKKNAQLATAWRLFAYAQRQTHDQPDATSMQLNAVAATRASELQTRLSKLSIDVAPDYRRDGLEVLRDADRVDPGAWNQLLPIDGGIYKIMARAPGHATWSTTVVVKLEGDIRIVAVPKLDPLTGAKPKPDERPPAPIGAPPVRTPPTDAKPTPAPPTGTKPTPAPPTDAKPTPVPPTSAPPTPEQPQAPLSLDEPRSENLALTLSLGGTLVSWGLLIAAGPPTDNSAIALLTAGGVGVALAPSFGHWYAGKYFPRGMWFRLASPLVLTDGVALVVNSYFQDSSAGKTVGAVLALTGAGLFVYGTVDDIVTARSRVRQWNQGHDFAIAPVVTSNAAGLTLGGRF